MRILENALEELSPKCRAVLELFHFEGHPQKEIADQQGISVSMEEKNVRQAVITVKSAWLKRAPNRRVRASSCWQPLRRCAH